MQHIAIVLASEQGELIERCEVNFAELLTKFNDHKDLNEQYEWVSTIDPYGTTTFNLYQIPYLIRDLNKLKEKDFSEGTKKKITDTITFLEKIKQHVYVRFVGD